MSYVLGFWIMTGSWALQTISAYLWRRKVRRLREENKALRILLGADQSRQLGEFLMRSIGRRP